MKRWLIERLKFSFKLVLSVALIFSWVFSGFPQLLNFPPSPNNADAAITYQSTGGVAYSNAAAVAYPASLAAGDLMILLVGMKPSTANSGSIKVPSGWTSITSLVGAGGYGATLGADTGNTNVFGFYKVATASDTGSLLIEHVTNNVAWAQVYRLTNANNDWSVAGTTGSDIVGDASVSIAMSANPGVTAGDFILGAMVIPTDVSTPGQFGTEAFSQTGVTFGAVTEIGEPDNTTGNDIGGFVIRSSVSSGTGSAAPTMTAAAAGTVTNVRGPGIFIRIREVPPTFEQSAFRFFNNNNGTDVGSALASQDTVATLGSTGSSFRLRTLIHIGAGELPLNGQNFKLQFAQRSGTCDTGFSGESYSDVTAGTVIAFNDNITPADGDNLTANANDPTHSGHTIVNQDYEELNNFTNSVAAIPVGQDGKWDFSLIDNGATSNTSYCIRIVKSDSSLLDTYSVIPEIITTSGGNSLPIASAVSIDSGATSITLTEGTTKNVSCVGTVTDNDGFADIVSVTADFFRTSVGSGSALDDNDHYRLTGDSQCIPSSGSGNSETYTCTFAIQYFADATDSGSPNSTDDWTCSLSPSDSVGDGTKSEDTVEIASLLALDVTSSIDYGSLSPGANTGATNQTTVVSNTGNRDMDPQLSGSNLTSGADSIAVGQQKYNSSSFTYSSGGINLSSTPTTINLSLPQRTSTAVSASVYWGIEISPGAPPKNYTGTNTFTAISGI